MSAVCLHSKYAIFGAKIQIFQSITDANFWRENSNMRHFWVIFKHLDCVNFQKGSFIMFSRLWCNKKDGFLSEKEEAKRNWFISIGNGRLVGRHIQNSLLHDDRRKNDPMIQLCFHHRNNMSITHSPENIQNKFNCFFLCEN